MSQMTPDAGTSTPESFGLRAGILSQAETLAQSLSSIAPTACVAMGIPLVIGASGPSAWLAYVVATVAVLLVAANINVFASDSASPGSLYGFVRSDLGPWAGSVAGWSLLIAYVGTASAVTGGIVQYAQTLVSGQPPQLVASIALILFLGARRYGVCVPQCGAVRALYVVDRVHLGSRHRTALCVP